MKLRGDGFSAYCVPTNVNDRGPVVTDWLEQLLYRTAEPGAYERWSTHPLPFDAPPMRGALAELTTSMGSWSIDKAGADVFNNTAMCGMTNQSSAFTTTLPAGVRADLDGQVGVFALPRMTSTDLPPLDVTGDTLVVFRNKPEVMDLVAYLAAPQAAAAWQRTGAVLFPYKTQDVANYPTALYQGMAVSIVNGTEFIFDASDSMPPAFGTVSLPKAMAEYGGNPNQDVAAFLARLDGAWPAP